MQDFWQEYQAWTASTAVYPDAGLGTAVARDYACLGLADEVGEVAGKLKKAIRGDGEKCGYAALEAFKSGEKQIALRDELGDVLYYVARYCVENKESLSVALSEIHGFVQSRTDVVKVLKQLVSSVGTLFEYPEDSYENIQNVVLFLSELAGWLGLDLVQIAQANQEKLDSRKERGVLKGSGDKR